MHPNVGVIARFLSALQQLDELTLHVLQTESGWVSSFRSTYLQHPNNGGGQCRITHRAKEHAPVYQHAKQTEYEKQDDQRDDSHLHLCCSHCWRHLTSFASCQNDLHSHAALVSGARLIIRACKSEERTHGGCWLVYSNASEQGGTDHYQEWQRQQRIVVQQLRGAHSLLGSGLLDKYQIGCLQKAAQQRKYIPSTSSL